MEKLKKFAVIGGDLRQGCLANLLYQRGYDICALALEDCPNILSQIEKSKKGIEALRACDVIILPLPLLGNGMQISAPFCNYPPTLEECFELAPKATYFAGMVSKEMKQFFQEHKIKMQDYYQREELTILNCIPTAEGALAIAMQETAETIFGSRCLVTGFGRVSKVLCKLLLGCGAFVQVAARKPSDLAWIQAIGAHAVPMQKLQEAIKDTDILFNTVPERILNAAELATLPSGALVIDLASKPGGVDFDAAKQLGVRAIWALSLPGKVAPVTAARYIADTVLQILKEQEE